MEYLPNVEYPNIGRMPNIPENTLVAVKTKGLNNHAARRVKDWHWGIQNSISDISSFTIVDPEYKAEPTWFEKGEQPPVGTLCEVNCSTRTTWFECVILPDGYIASKKLNGAWVAQPITDFEVLQFRPTRTEKEIVIEAAMKVTNGGLTKDMYSALYDACMLHLPSKEPK